MKFKRTFTPQEANIRLPLIKQIVADILAKGKDFRARLSKHTGPEMPVECLNLQAEIEGLMIELEDLGCYYKDWNFEIELVDFPAVIDGQQVLLCWRSDEERLKWYHSLQDGYPGRRPIPEYLLN